MKTNEESSGNGNSNINGDTWCELGGPFEEKRKKCGHVAVIPFPFPPIQIGKS